MRFGHGNRLRDVGSLAEIRVIFAMSLDLEDDYDRSLDDKVDTGKWRVKINEHPARAVDPK